MVHAAATIEQPFTSVVNVIISISDIPKVC